MEFKVALLRGTPRRVYGFVVSRRKVRSRAADKRYSCKIAKAMKTEFKRESCLNSFSSVLLVLAETPPTMMRARLIAITSAICGSAAGVLYQRQECIPEDIRGFLFAFVDTGIRSLSRHGENLRFPFALFSR